MFPVLQLIEPAAKLCESWHSTADKFGYHAAYMIKAWESRIGNPDFESVEKKFIISFSIPQEVIIPTF